MSRDDLRRARGRFAAMAATYSLGVFNDNFFKQGASLLAIAAGATRLQGLAATVYTLPWLLFSAHAGWLADRLPKRSVVIASKALELIAMLAGAAGILLTDWSLVMVMLFLMALQSTIFSPALNGSIPELYPAEHVMKANSTLKAVTTSSILIGIVAAGQALAVKTPLTGWATWGQGILAAGVVAVAVVGLVVSFGVPRRPAADPTVAFPWTGPIETVRELIRIVRTDYLLTVVIVADMLVWFIAVLQILVINVLGLEQYGIGENRTSFLQVAELGGVAVGGLLAGRLSTGRRWYRLIAPGFALLCVPMFLIALVPLLPAWWQVPAVAVGLLAAGIPGGMLLVPLEAFFQVRPEPKHKGAVIAAANFAGFAAMALAGGAFVVVNTLFKPTEAFAAMGALAVLAAVGAFAALRRPGVC